MQRKQNKTAGATYKHTQSPYREEIAVSYLSHLPRHISKFSFALASSLLLFLKNMSNKKRFWGALFFVSAFSLVSFISPTKPSQARDTRIHSERKQTAIDIALPSVKYAEESTDQSSSSSIHTKEIKVKNGDSMSLVFQRAGLGASVVHKLAYQSEHGQAFSNILPGKFFQFLFHKDGSLYKVVYSLSELERYEATYDGSIFETDQIILTPEIYTNIRSGVIENSLFLDGSSAGLTDNQIMELANIFGWDIDFALEIRKGDRFSVLFEERYLNGEYLGTGRILAAEFVNRNKPIKAVRYEDQNGQASFYTPEGLSMRKAFLRTPLDVFRISSHFNLNRRHPVLNRIRAHKGTDYAAPTGTPVRAAGDGKITFAGVNGGYGNMLKITHRQNYETRYAHLNSFASGIRNGKWVTQGQIIGYVGSTGLATGPHLHYEFYKNGAVRNPVTVTLPNGSPIDSSELENFKLTTSPLLAQLASSAESYLAQTSKDTDNES